MANRLEPSDGRLLWWRAGYDARVSLGRSVALVFQDPTLTLWARVAANVRLPLESRGRPDACREPRVTAALARVGLRDFCPPLPAPAVWRHEDARFDCPQPVIGARETDAPALGGNSSAVT
jgi:ABC-type nitrate/sulfonate/bicarbonate transport system ATPase subunit